MRYEWSGDNEVTMRGFTNGIKQQHMKAEAFKKAQMAIKEDNPNPYFWAPFIMIDLFYDIG